MSNVELRTFVFLDSLQLQLAAFIGTVSRGFPPVAGDASLFVEIDPAMEINRMMDIVIKATHVRPAMQIVERRYGLLEVHSADQAQVRQAGKIILNNIGAKESDRKKPRIVSQQIIQRIDDYHAQLINRSRHGSMILSKQTLFILETDPAGYAVLAANEAEKAAEINLVEVTPFGAFGRLYLGGEEADVQAGAQAAISAIEGTSGK